MLHADHDDDVPLVHGCVYDTGDTGFMVVNCSAAETRRYWYGPVGYQDWWGTIRQAHRFATLTDAQRLLSAMIMHDDRRNHYRRRRNPKSEVTYGIVDLRTGIVTRYG